MIAKERELRTARVEIDALKATSARRPIRRSSRNSRRVRNSLREAQARCVELSAAVADRDARLASAAAPIPSFIALPVAPATESEAELIARVEMLESNITERDAQITERDAHLAELQARLDDELASVRAIRDELASRAAEIERARAESAKWQARVPKLVATIKARDTTLAELDTTLRREATIASAMQR